MFFLTLLLTYYVSSYIDYNAKCFRLYFNGNYGCTVEVR